MDKNVGNREYEKPNYWRLKDRRCFKAYLAGMAIINQIFISPEDLANAGNLPLVGIDTSARGLEVFTTIREPMVILDRKLTVRSANKSFYRTFRLTREDSEGKSIYDLRDQAWEEALRLLFKSIPKNRKLVNYEVEFEIPHLGKRCMMINAREIKRQKVNERLILLVIEDITHRVELQKSKTQLLQRFRELVIQAPVAVCILQGIDHVVEIANTAYLDLIGKTKSIIGNPLFDSLPVLRDQGIPELLDTVLKSGETYHGKEVELFFDRATGSTSTFYNFVYQPMFDSQTGDVAGIIVVVNEITEQVKARKIMEWQASMVQELLMTAPGFVCMLEGPKHVYSLINERYQQLVGKRDITNKPMLKALPELKGQGIEEILRKVYKTGIPYIGIDEPFFLGRDVGLESELRHFNYSCQPMYNVNRKIYAILIFGYEVTEQVNALNRIAELRAIHTRELEEKVALRTSELQSSNMELLKKISELGKKNKELESFNYISSHDLQEPLRKIQLFAGRILELDQDGCVSDEAKSHFERIQAAAGRMQALLEDLLTYSRAGVSERVFENTDLKEVVADVLDALSESILDTRAEITVGKLCHPDVNPSQFRQVVNNIVGNSLKYYQKDGRPQISIKSRPVPGLSVKGLELPDGTYCHFSIEDRGIGFKPQYAEKIFEVFQRLHSKDDYQGTGIGLAIVKKIVENHHGKISATSVPGEGSVFNIYIPMRHAEPVIQ